MSIKIQVQSRTGEYQATVSHEQDVTYVVPGKFYDYEIQVKPRRRRKVKQLEPVENNFGKPRLVSAR